MIGKTIEKSLAIVDKIEDWKEKVKFLKENKAELIAQKKEAVKYSMPISLSIQGGKKADKSEPIDLTDKNKIEVKVIGNLSMYMDSHRDVQGDKCWDKTIQESQDKFYHTKNHSGKVDDMVGDVQKVYMSTVNLKDLGVNTAIKTGQALTMDSNVYKSLDEKIFTQYGIGLIKQHSVGMWYVKLELAINDQDEEEEFKVWTKHIDKVINREVAEKFGYFWYVAESKLIEISAVTRGSNDITPTLEVKKPSNSDTQEEEPSHDTQEKQKQFFKSLLN